ncbi:MAG TPA: M20/M25/M40 family metallo-hydrolase [Flavobacteriales bacterium]|nr:M20/M25/M40 family metallo-hydrolase [Flavobacteriales bacterium]
MRTLSFLTLALAPLSLVTAQGTDAVKASARAVIGTLTSPAFHGRGYVENGDGLAAEWIAQQYTRIGLKPVKSDFYEPFQFNVNSFPDSLHVAIDGVRMVPGIDFIVDPASGKASGRYTLVHLEPDDLFDPERRAMTMGVLTGQAACLHFPKTTNADTLHKYAEIERDLMHYCPVVRPSHGKLTWGASQEAMPFPLIEIANAALTDSSVAIDLRIQNKLIGRHEARNVLGHVKGKGKKWIVIGAHYDHLGHMGPDAMFPGANDNASGVAMLLSLAEHFAKNKPKMNILFVAFAGEEAGLAGSDWFIVDRPIDLGKIRLMLNLDIMGTGDEGITVVNATARQAEYDALVKINDDKKYVPQVKSRGPACNSDHCPFVKRGVPAIFVYTMGGITAYHDVLDKAETLPLTEFSDLQALFRDFISTLK